MSHRQQRVLVVDDDVDACHNLSDILTDLDYLVDIAHSGEVAVPLIERQPYDVALIDLKMPGMDGIAFYRLLRRIRPEAVAVLITAYATREAESEVTREGDLEVLAKPVNLGRLIPFIEDAVQQPLVLIVDDDEDLCRSLWEVLRERGFRVSIAGSAEEAATRLRDRDFSVVLVDLRLPDSNGTEVARAIHGRDPHARILLMTGCREEMQDLIQQSLTAHADAICYKPLDLPHLLTEIRRLAQPE
jgi:DNA-binding NtrC family response regulator